jgi:hypothetical protein
MLRRARTQRSVATCVDVYELEIEHWRVLETAVKERDERGGCDRGAAPVVVIEGRLRINAQMRRSHKVEESAAAQQEAVLYMYYDVIVPSVCLRCFPDSRSRWIDECLCVSGSDSRITIDTCEKEQQTCLTSMRWRKSDQIVFAVDENSSRCARWWDRDTPYARYVPSVVLCVGLSAGGLISLVPCTPDPSDAIRSRDQHTHQRLLGDISICTDTRNGSWP